MALNPLEIIEKFYAAGSRTFVLLVRHGMAVAQKAVTIAGGRTAPLNPDMEFLQEAAMLHDIGIFLTDSRNLVCIGSHPDVRHGYLGNQILSELGFPRHGRVCECHVGVGISAEVIRRFGLPLPERDLLPVTLEEEILCYADKFHSKNGRPEGRVKTFEEIENSLKMLGVSHLNRFREWAYRFEGVRL